MEIAYKYIQRFQVVRMWGRINLHWADLNNDVNILVGINGSGKNDLAEFDTRLLYRSKD